MEKNRAAADEEAVIPSETCHQGAKSESLTEVEPGEGSHVEYTELALDCLDLKAQEELLSPPPSGDNSISLTDLAL